MTIYQEKVFEYEYNHGMLVRKEYAVEKGTVNKMEKKMEEERWRQIGRGNHLEKFFLR